VLCVWGKYAQLNAFYNVNEFYVSQQEFLHSPTELPADNCRYINGDIYVEPWLFQKINVTLITYLAAITWHLAVSPGPRSKQVRCPRQWFRQWIVYCIAFILCTLRIIDVFVLLSRRLIHPTTDCDSGKSKL